MDKLHIALSTHEIGPTVEDYSRRLGVPPCVHVPGQYALWRTACLNLSVRRDPEQPSGALRHLGWEDADAAEFSEDRDVNGIVWERFSAQQQAAEIREIWPEVDYRPDEA